MVRFKGEFQLPDVGVKCGYSEESFPIVRCIFDAQVTGRFPQKEKWN